jgi:hypothetical protein
LPGKRPATGDAAGAAPQLDQTVAGPT